MSLDTNEGVRPRAAHTTRLVKAQHAPVAKDNSVRATTKGAE